MALDKDQIRDLLGTGLSNEQVAGAVGCESGYITQLMADDEFKNAVISRRALALTANNKRDLTIDSLEDKLLSKAHELIDQGAIYKPQDVIRTMSLVNNMKRRGVPAHESLTLRQTIVSLILPTQVLPEFVTNVRGEVIEVSTEDGGRKSLQTMPAQTLLQKLARESKDGNKYEQLRKFLPPSSVRTESEQGQGQGQEKQPAMLENSGRG